MFCKARLFQDEDEEDVALDGSEIVGALAFWMYSTLLSGPRPLQDLTCVQL